MSTRLLRPPRRTLWSIFKIPIVIGALVALGLTTALIGDDVWDWLSWLLLAVPLALFATCLARARRATRPAQPVTFSAGSAATSPTDQSAKA
jgi:hypothetical protein